MFILINSLYIVAPGIGKSIYRKCNILPHTSFVDNWDDRKIERRELTRTLYDSKRLEIPGA